MRFADFIQACRRLHGAMRARRLNADNRPLWIEITREHAELPGKTGCRMETKQRRAITFTQRQNGFESHALGAVFFTINNRCQFGDS